MRHGLLLYTIRVKPRILTHLECKINREYVCCKNCGQKQASILRLIICTNISAIAKR